MELVFEIPDGKYHGGSCLNYNQKILSAVYLKLLKLMLRLEDCNVLN